MYWPSFSREKSILFVFSTSGNVNEAENCTLINYIDLWNCQHGHVGCSENFFWSVDYTSVTRPKWWVHPYSPDV